jgi:hypothetical protein
MSDNPFRDLTPVNPYQSSTEYSPHSMPSKSNPLMVPAIFLLTLSVLALAANVISLPFQLANINRIDTSTPEGAGRMIGTVIGMSLVPIFAVAIIIGSICMLRLKGYSGAMTAAICACIPFCSPCVVLGIPFGIWALVLLANPDVKNRFQ